MTQEDFFKFMKRILEKGSVEKSLESLRQLRKILEEQNAGIEVLKLVDSTIESVPEAKEEAVKDSFSKESLIIAFRRAADRRRREEEMAARGRC